MTRALDAASTLLAGLPANGFTDLLQGALLLGRNSVADAKRGWTPLPTLGWVPRYDHIVVVVLENHSRDEILGVDDTNQSPVPYINTVLVPGGALMTSSYGLQHPSQPNYYWLFSGNNQGVTTDAPPIKTDGTNAVNATAPNLYTELQSQRRPKSFVGYVEGYSGPADLSQPEGVFTFTGSIASEPGTTGTLANVVRHAPWAGFTNVPQSVSQDFVSVGPDATFGPDFSTLPDVSFVIPALQHDMHNFGYGAVAENLDVATSDTSMANADAWLQQNIAAYAQWAVNNNSLLIVTTDEDSTPDWQTPPLPFVNYSGPNGHNPLEPGTPGFTSAAQGPSATANNPSGSGQSGPNTIFTLFYGAHVVPGTYSNPITNVNVLRTIEASMRIPTKAGAQPSFVGLASSGARDRSLRFNNHAVRNIFSVCLR